MLVSDKVNFKPKLTRRDEKETVYLLKENKPSK